MRRVCVPKAVTSACVINTTSFTIAIDCIRYSDSFGILQAKVKCHLSVGPPRPVPRALNKQYSDYCIFRLYYLGLLGDHLRQVS